MIIFIQDALKIQKVARSGGVFGLLEFVKIFTLHTLNKRKILCTRNSNKIAKVLIVNKKTRFSLVFFYIRAYLCRYIFIYSKLPNL